jgi:hypothetical protein
VPLEQLARQIAAPEQADFDYIQLVPQLTSCSKTEK